MSTSDTDSHTKSSEEIAQAAIERWRKSPNQQKPGLHSRGHNLGSPKMTAQAQQVGTPAQQAQPQPAQVPNQPPQAQAGGGGGGNGGGNASGGGNGHNNQPSWLDRQNIFVLILVWIGVMILIWTFGSILVAGNMKVQTEYVNPGIREQLDLAERSQRIFNNSQVSKEKQTITVPMFDCSTEEKRDRGFEQTSAVLIQSGTQYRLNGGCALIEIDTHIAQLSGDKYYFIQADAASSTGWKVCGTVAGANDSHYSCATFLNSRRGQQVRVINPDGGYVQLN